MERKTSPGDDLTPLEAQEALAVLAADRGSLADRVRAPRWYNPALGAIMAVLVGSPGVSSGTLRSSMVSLATVALVFVILGYKRATGFSVSAANGGRRTIGRTVVVGAVVVVLFVASMVLGATGHGLWVWLVALGAFATAVVGGAYVDRAYAEELRDGR